MPTITNAVATILNRTLVPYRNHLEVESNSAKRDYRVYCLTDDVSVPKHDGLT